MPAWTLKSKSASIPVTIPRARKNTQPLQSNPKAWSSRAAIATRTAPSISGKNIRTTLAANCSGTNSQTIGPVNCSSPRTKRISGSCPHPKHFRAIPGLVGCWAIANIRRRRTRCRWETFYASAVLEWWSLKPTTVLKIAFYPRKKFRKS